VSARQLAAIVGCAAVAGGILLGYHRPNDGGLGLELSAAAEEAELVHLVGVPATTSPA
jgi:hypothetical protein